VSLARTPEALRELIKYAKALGFQDDVILWENELFRVELELLNKEKNG
jgi:hypothetical protein